MTRTDVEQYWKNRARQLEHSIEVLNETWRETPFALRQDSGYRLRITERLAKAQKDLKFARECVGILKEKGPVISDEAPSRTT